MRQLSGFGLLELIITLVVISSVALATLQPLTSRYYYHLYEQQFSKLKQSLTFARQLALSSNSQVTLCPSGNGNDCDEDWTEPILIFTDLNNNQTLDHSEQLYQKLVLNKVSVLSNRDLLRFSPANNAGSTAATLTLCLVHGIGIQKMKALIISNVGRIREEVIPNCVKN